MNALVLSGGAARGFAHIGVYKNIQKLGINFDIITGTSMGAGIGAFIADGKTYEEIIEIMEGVSWLKLLSKPDKGSLMDGKGILDFIEKYFGNRKIEDLPKKFACVATDIDSGEEILFDKGPIKDALRATISIPGILKPHELNGRYLVDGGLVNNLPILQAEKMGATKILAINVRRSKTRKTLYRELNEKNDNNFIKFFKAKRVKMFYDFCEKTYDIMANIIDEKQVKNAKTPIILKHIGIPKIKYIAFLQWRKIVEHGEKVDISDFLS